MSPAAAKSIVRIIGTLIGVIGALIFIGGLVQEAALLMEAIRHGFSALVMLDALLGGLALLLGAHSVNVAYRTWFRLSPLAVQHVCGILAFIMWVTLNRLPALGLHGHPSTEQSKWLGALGLGLLLLVAILYRLISRLLTRALFPALSSTEARP